MTGGEAAREAADLYEAVDAATRAVAGVRSADEVLQVIVDQGNESSRVTGEAPVPW